MNTTLILTLIHVNVPLQKKYSVQMVNSTIVHSVEIDKPSLKHVS